jgi:hypothetical protein
MNHCLGPGGTLRPAMVRIDQIFGEFSECIASIVEVTDRCGSSDNDGLFSQTILRGSRA